jgi:3'5'-cyclic nucleotide phosphodiesterase
VIHCLTPHFLLASVVDHTGVPNAQLCKEQAPIAEFYKGRCPAEQNAVDLAWQMLMDDAFIDLRELIYTNDDELQRFRSVVVNGVMATDLFDAELKRDRTARWSRAFSPSPILKAKSRSSHGSSSVGSGNSGRESAAALEELTNRKATVVLEYLLQASDVGYAMQPWHMYRKWDELAFLEHYKAYMEGRADSVDPVTAWYEGEMASFDFVVIPLAKKLRDSGVFGTSGDEYLSFALRNRAEWEDRGREVLNEMSNLARRTYGM